MNKILIILSLVFLAACSSKETPSENLVARQGIMYKVNSQTPFTGVATTYHENGQLMSKANWKDGKQSGLFESYLENGQLEHKIILKDGFVETATNYDENGQVASKYNYKNEKLNGLAEIYYENGQLRMRANYKNDELVQLIENYDQNGNDISNVRFVQESRRANGTLSSKVSYLGEIKDGPDEYYDFEGQLRMTTNYKDGVRHGLVSLHVGGETDSICYQNDEKADMSYCEK